MSLKEHIQMMTLLASMMGDPGRPSIRFVNDETYSDLVSEYKLIQQKKSSLSRSQRDSVVARVERLVKQGKIILPEPPQQ